MVEALLSVRDTPRTMSYLNAALKTYRLQKSRSISKPAYVVFSNKSLVALTEAQPLTLAALKRVAGKGSSALQLFFAICARSN